MKKWIATALFASLTLALHAHSIIPQPGSYQKKKGTLTLKSGAFLQASPERVKPYIRTLQRGTSLELKMAPEDASGAVQFLSGEAAGQRKPLPEAGYILRVSPTSVNIYADSPSGHFYGLQTLVQLLKSGDQKAGSITIPCCEVRDVPRFRWRGFMLDESRHFSGMDAVKRLLDAMAYYKMNRFHWHLTDSDGWRIEIKKYPKLTTVGGIGNKSDPKATAQFYTQDQIREIVAYARQRHIVVIPEIDMPGHANAAVRAYPQFSGGKSKKHGEFTFNPADPATDAFLKDILREVAGLFPDAGVIHYGGDEVHFGWDQWPELPQVKKRMQEQGMKLKDVEKAFNQRFAKVINGLGFKTGGWDEIAHAGLDKEKTVVFWWRHDKPRELQYALKNGYDVVLCPRRPCYFDFVQHTSHKKGRRWGGFNPLKDVYAFPDTLKLPKTYSGKILGIQANLWTETTVTQERRDFMIFPRLIALAEAAWTSGNNKDYPDFEKRLKPHLPQLKQRGIQYYNPFTDSPEIKR